MLLGSPEFHVPCLVLRVWLGWGQGFSCVLTGLIGSGNGTTGDLTPDF